MLKTIFSDKFNLYFIPLATVFCISLLFSCTSDLQPPPLPDEPDLEPPPESSSSYNALQSSSSELVYSSSSVASSSSMGASSSSSSGNLSSSGGSVIISSSSSAGASSSSFALVPGTVWCQLPNGTCRQYASEFCEMVEGTIVPSCNLTCEMPSPASVQQNTAMNPPPIVKCNGNVVSSSGIVWTPANLIFASVGLQTLRAKVENCNNITVDCGQVNVQSMDEY